MDGITQILNLTRAVYLRIIKSTVLLPTPYLLTHSLHTAVLLEKLTGLQLVEKFPTICGTRRFITAVTSARYLSLPRASSFQSIPSRTTS
jgi:hypothetical protein